MSVAHSSHGDKRIVLIVSTGRTGTKALAQHLDGCFQQVRAVHEPPPTRVRLRRMANRYLCGRLSRQALVSELAWHRDRMLAGTPQAMYVESNPGLSGFLDAFADVFNDFRVFHVVRDPRTYIPSALNWGVFRGVKGMLARFLPYWLPKPELADPAARLRWSAMSPAERLAWHWVLINTHLDRAATLHPDRYLRMTFEDLFARDGAGLARLVDWLGLPPTQDLALAANAEQVNASAPATVRRWRDWEPEARQTVLKHCAPLMTAYGYDLGPDADLVTPAPHPANGLQHA